MWSMAAPAHPLRIADCKLQIADCKLQIPPPTHSEFRISNFEFWAFSSPSPSPLPLPYEERKFEGEDPSHPERGGEMGALKSRESFHSHGPVPGTIEIASCPVVELHRGAWHDMADRRG